MELRIVGSRTVLDHRYVIIEHVGVSSRSLHADIGRHAADEHALDSSCLQNRVQIRIDERAITVLDDDTFARKRCDSIVELRSPGSLAAGAEGGLLRFTVNP